MAPANSPTETNLFITVLETMKWPLVVVVIALIFIKPIKELFSKLSKLKLFGNEIDLTPGDQTQLQLSHVNDSLSDIERTIASYNSETVSLFKTHVTTESNYNSTKNKDESIELLVNYSIVLAMTNTFNNTYNLIFGSQLRLLLYLNTVRGRGDSFTDLKRFYDEVDSNKYLMPPYERYLAFLLQQQLINEKDNIFNLTIIGGDFISYLARNGKSFEKPL